MFRRRRRYLTVTSEMPLPVRFYVPALPPVGNGILGVEANETAVTADERHDDESS